MEGWERLQYIMNEAGLNKNSFSNAIGLTNNVTITRIINEKRNPSRATCQKIIAAFPQYSFDWLFAGRGEMLKEVSPNANSLQMIVPRKDNANLLIPQIMLVPLIDQYAYAGYIYGYQEQTFIDRLPKIPFIVDHEGKGNYVAFEVKGDSMDDGTDEGYREGDKILCREVYPHLWQNSKLHIKKWDFVIIHEDGILLKRILEHDVENHTITIHSLNSDMYEDRVIDLKEVKQIFNVIELMRSRRR